MYFSADFRWEREREITQCISNLSVPLSLSWTENKNEMRLKHLNSNIIRESVTKPVAKFCLVRILQTLIAKSKNELMFTLSLCHPIHNPILNKILSLLDRDVKNLDHSELNEIYRSSVSKKGFFYFYIFYFKVGSLIYFMYTSVIYD